MQSDREVYNSYYKYILTSYNVKVKSEYQFIYDEFLDHLILDSTKINTKENFEDKWQVTFRGQFYQHFKSREWHDKIMNPDKCQETIKRLRKYKLEKININYGN